jgi:hypothetical protein
MHLLIFCQYLYFILFTYLNQFVLTIFINSLMINSLKIICLYYQLKEFELGIHQDFEHFES